MQPLPFLPFQVREDRLAGGASAEVDVGGFKSHRSEQLHLLALGFQGCQFDARAMWAQATNDPAAAQLDKGIGTAHRAADDRLIKNFGRTLLPLGPVTGGGDQGLGFAGNFSSVPVGDGDVAGVAEASQSGNAMGNAVVEIAVGHQMFDGVDGADRHVGFYRGQSIHLGPKMNRVAQFTLSDAAQPFVLLSQDKRQAALAHTVAIAFKNRIADIGSLQGEMAGLSGEVSADGQAYKVVGVGERMSFVKIVDTPDQAAFGVAPGAKIFNVEIADGEYVRCLREIGTDLRPDLCPAVVRGSQKGKDSLFHAGVLQAEIFFDQIGAEGQPFFEAVGGFDDIHAAQRLASLGAEVNGAEAKG